MREFRKLNREERGTGVSKIIHIISETRAETTDNRGDMYHEVTRKRGRFAGAGKEMLESAGRSAALHFFRSTSFPAGY